MSMYSDPESGEAEHIRKNRRITSIAATYNDAMAEDRTAIDQAITAGLTLSTNTLLRAGYADNAKAAITELNEKDN